MPIFFMHDGGPPITADFTAQVLDNVVDTLPHAFAAQSIGTAAANRTVACFLTYATTNASGVATLTIGGVSATLVASIVDQSNQFHDLWVAAVPTGTTAVVELLTPTVSMQQFHISLYAIYGAASSTPTSTDTDQLDGITSTDLSVSLTVVAGGVAIAKNYATDPGSQATTWTELTEDDDAGTWASAHKEYATAATPTITTTQANDNATTRNIVAAAWSP
jgi:hypothetical protein